MNVLWKRIIIISCRGDDGEALIGKFINDGSANTFCATRYYYRFVDYLCLYSELKVVKLKA